MVYFVHGVFRISCFIVYALVNFPTDPALPVITEWSRGSEVPFVLGEPGWES